MSDIAKNEKRFALLLQAVGADSYTTPVNKEDTIVMLARLRPMNAADRELVMAEARIFRFIEDALTLSEQPEHKNAWRLRFSRPWVLKKNKAENEAGDARFSLAFTWDFTIQGDVNAALNALESIKPMTLTPSVREEEVPVHQVVRGKGRVRQVQIGAIR